MANTRPKPEDLAERLEHLSSLLAELEQELVQLYSQGEVAPTSSWITRYQARGKSKRYWYYKWQSSYPVFPTTDGQLSRYKHLGKAGSSAYLEAVTQILRRAQTEGLEQAIKTLKAGLQDLCEEGMKNRTEGNISSRRYFREQYQIYSNLRKPRVSFLLNIENSTSRLIRDFSYLWQEENELFLSSSCTLSHFMMELTRVCNAS